MGCGKTTLGKALAQKLNYKFIDLDAWFEEQNKTTIAEYFEVHGETKFREKEHEFIIESQKLTNTIISTGGGAACFYNNIKVMNQSGTTIYVKLSPQSLMNRLQNETTTRPLIANKTNNDLLAFIEQKLSEREPFYTQAQVVLDKEDSTVDEYVEEVLGI